ncbi:MAG: MerR family DNA-binding transcriptional regulator [Rhizobiaceae bacterium]
MPDTEQNIRLDELFSEAPGDTGFEKEIYRIGDLAREFGVTLRTLRFYEDRGLVSPERDGSTRLYSPRDRARLKVILLAKQVGFSLVEIQELMAIYDKSEDMEDPAGVLLDRFTEQLDVLVRQRNEMDAAIEKLKRTIQAFEAAS